MPSDLYAARSLSAEDLEVELPQSAIEKAPIDAAAPLVDVDDPFVLKVRRLLDQFGGVIFTGPPGTSKSWWAARIAEALTDGPGHRAFVQFHASYQYEDFMYGYVPSPDGSGFEGRKAIFLQACETAEKIAPNAFVLVVDEFSRADVGRVFGEALTYVEDTKRGMPFTIAAGLQVNVPSNLFVLATMNPFDRGVDEVDAAFERRFAKVSMNPDESQLAKFLEHLPIHIATRVLAWFRDMNGQRDAPLATLGHAYFKGVNDLESLREVWEYQLKYHVARAFRLNEEGRLRAEDGWKKIFSDVSGGWDGSTEPATSTEATPDEDSTGGAS